MNSTQEIRQTPSNITIKQILKYSFIPFQSELLRTKGNYENPQDMNTSKLRMRQVGNKSPQIKQPLLSNLSPLEKIRNYVGQKGKSSLGMEDLNQMNAVESAIIHNHQLKNEYAHHSLPDSNKKNISVYNIKVPLFKKLNVQKPKNEENNPLSNILRKQKKEKRPMRIVVKVDNSLGINKVSDENIHQFLINSQLKEKEEYIHKNTTSNLNIQENLQQLDFPCILQQQINKRNKSCTFYSDPKNVFKVQANKNKELNSKEQSQNLLPTQNRKLSSLPPQEQIKELPQVNVISRAKGKSQHSVFEEAIQTVVHPRNRQQQAIKQMQYKSDNDKKRIHSSLETKITLESQDFISNQLDSVKSVFTENQNISFILDNNNINNSESNNNNNSNNSNNNINNNNSMSNYNNKSNYYNNSNNNFYNNSSSSCSQKMTKSKSPFIIKEESSIFNGLTICDMKSKILLERPQFRQLNGQTVGHKTQNESCAYDLKTHSQAYNSVNQLNSSSPSFQDYIDTQKVQSRKSYNSQTQMEDYFTQVNPLFQKNDSFERFKTEQSYYDSFLTNNDKIVSSKPAKKYFYPPCKSSSNNQDKIAANGQLTHPWVVVNSQNILQEMDISTGDNLHKSSQEKKNQNQSLKCERIYQNIISATHPIDQEDNKFEVLNNYYTSKYSSHSFSFDMKPIGKQHNFNQQKTIANDTKANSSKTKTISFTDRLEPWGIEDLNIPFLGNHVGNLN